MAEENTNTATNTDTTPEGTQPVTPTEPVINADDVKTSAQAELVKSLGVESVDDLKAIISAKNEADEANKTELQKANDQATKLQNDLDSKDDELATVKAQVEALKLGVDDEHLNDAILLAKAENSEDISKGLSSVVERNPQFKGKVQPKTNPDGTSVLDDNLGGNNTNITQEDFNKMTYEERVSLFNKDKTLYESLNK